MSVILIYINQEENVIFLLTGSKAIRAEWPGRKDTGNGPQLDYLSPRSCPQADHLMFTRLINQLDIVFS